MSDDFLSAQETLKLPGRAPIPKYEIVNPGTPEEYARPSPAWLAYQTRQKSLVAYEKARLGDAESLSWDGYKGEDSAGNLPRLRTYIEGFGSKKPYPSIYMWSRLNATQKTTTARLIGRSLIDKGFSVKMVLMGSLIPLLTKLQSVEDETDQDEIRLLSEVDFLILDDSFDAKKVTVFKSGYQLSFLDTFLRNRLDVVKKPVCFTSNVPIEDISTVFGVSVQSLVKRYAVPLEFSDSINDFDIHSLF